MSKLQVDVEVGESKSSLDLGSVSGKRIFWIESSASRASVRGCAPLRTNKNQYCVPFKADCSSAQAAAAVDLHFDKFRSG